MIARDKHLVGCGHFKSTAYSHLKKIVVWYGCSLISLEGTGLLSQNTQLTFPVLIHKRILFRINYAIVGGYKFRFTLDHNYT